MYFIQKVKVKQPPELRIFTRFGEEISGDVLEYVFINNSLSLSLSLSLFALT